MNYMTPAMEEIKLERKATLLDISIGTNPGMNGTPSGDSPIIVGDDDEG